MGSHRFSQVSPEVYISFDPEHFCFFQTAGLELVHFILRVKVTHIVIIGSNIAPNSSMKKKKKLIIRDNK